MHKYSLISIFFLFNLEVVAQSPCAEVLTPLKITKYESNLKFHYDLDNFEELYQSGNTQAMESSGEYGAIKGAFDYQKTKNIVNHIRSKKERIDYSQSKSFLKYQSADPASIDAWKDCMNSQKLWMESKIKGNGDIYLSIQFRGRNDAKVIGWNVVNAREFSRPSITSSKFGSSEINWKNKDIVIVRKDKTKPLIANLSIDYQGDEFNATCYVPGELIKPIANQFSQDLVLGSNPINFTFKNETNANQELLIVFTSTSDHPPESGEYSANHPSLEIKDLTTNKIIERWGSASLSYDRLEMTNVPNIQPGRSYKVSGVVNYETAGGKAKGRLLIYQINK